jgi:mRNA interferase RelE/StbE
LARPLRHSKFGLWRYRVRDYRIICELRDTQLRVLVVAVGHLSAVYER